MPSASGAVEALRLVSHPGASPLVPLAGAQFTLDSTMLNDINHIVARSYVMERATPRACREEAGQKEGNGDVREEDQSPAHSPPGRPRPGTGLGGEGDDHAEAPGKRPDHPPGAHRGGGEAG